MGARPETGHFTYWENAVRVARALSKIYGVRYRVSWRSEGQPMRRWWVEPCSDPTE